MSQEYWNKPFDPVPLMSQVRRESLKLYMDRMHRCTRKERHIKTLEGYLSLRGQKASLAVSFEKLFLHGIRDLFLGGKMNRNDFEAFLKNLLEVAINLQEEHVFLSRDRYEIYGHRQDFTQPKMPLTDLGSVAEESHSAPTVTSTDELQDVNTGPALQIMLARWHRAYNRMVVSPSQPSNFALTIDQICQLKQNMAAFYKADNSVRSHNDPPSTSSNVRQCHVTGGIFPVRDVWSLFLVSPMFIEKELAYLFDVDPIGLDTSHPSNGIQMNKYLAHALDLNCLVIYPTFKVSPSRARTLSARKTDYTGETLSSDDAQAPEQEQEQRTLSWASSHINQYGEVIGNPFPQWKDLVTGLGNLNTNDATNVPARQFLFFRFLTTYLYYLRRANQVVIEELDECAEHWPEALGRQMPLLVPCASHPETNISPFAPAASSRLYKSPFPPLVGCRTTATSTRIYLRESMLQAIAEEYAGTRLPEPQWLRNCYRYRASKQTPDSESAQSHVPRQAGAEVSPSLTLLPEAPSGGTPLSAPEAQIRKDEEIMGLSMAIRLKLLEAKAQRTRRVGFSRPPQD
ncbi:hypothetical protein MMC25_000310 [Agyrium rufum]|nr:hypothetical protein [Agyrium rufum]